LENLKGRDHLGYLGVDERIKLKRIIKLGCRELVLILVAQDRVQ
jgi:hypothetical protein